VAPTAPADDRRKHPDAEQPPGNKINWKKLRPINPKADCEFKFRPRFG
jgi:hypothetical protein